MVIGYYERFCAININQHGVIEHICMRALDVDFFPRCIAGNWPFSSDRLRRAL